MFAEHNDISPEEEYSEKTSFGSESGEEFLLDEDEEYLPKLAEKSHMQIVDHGMSLVQGVFINNFVLLDILTLTFSLLTTKNKILDFFIRFHTISKKCSTDIDN